MKRWLCAVIIMTLCVSSLRARADEALPPDHDRLGWAVPDYARVGTGGFIGMFTLGIGYSALRDVINVQLSYGYVPPRNRVGHVHIGTLTASVRPLRFTLGPQEQYYYYPIYVGGGLMAASGPNLFIEQPPEYPKGYYAPTALHYMLLFGTQFDFRLPAESPFLRHGLFVEVVTLDQYLDAIAQNQDVKLLDGFSTAVGYRLTF